MYVSKAADCWLSFILFHVYSDSSNRRRHVKATYLVSLISAFEVETPPKKIE